MRSTCLAIIPARAGQPYLVGEAGGGGAAAVVGDGGGQVPQRAAHRGVGAAASALVLVTAAGLPKGGHPVRGAGGHRRPKLDEVLSRLLPWVQACDKSRLSFQTQG